MNCIFCKIINKEIPSLTLYEDSKLIVIMDAFPDSDGHVLIIPKIHHETFMDLTDDLYNYIFLFAKKFTNILMHCLEKDSLTLLINYGNSQVVKHFHLHLIPNFKEDAVLKKEEVYLKLMEYLNENKI